MLKRYIVVAALLTPCIGFSQSALEATISQFDGKSVRSYIQPFGDLFGATMNAGLYRSARVPQDGFHVQIDLVGMATVVTDEYRTYDAELPSGFMPDGGSLKTATVFGGRGTTFKDVNTGLEYKSSDGVFDTRLFPLFVPQLTIGSLFGTQLSIRYISTPELGGGKFPSSTLLGAGIRHSISRYFSNSPIDIAIGGYYSTFDVGNIIAFEGGAVNLQVSRSFSLLTLYSGIAWETSRTDIRYKAESLPEKPFVNISLRGGNSFRFTGGMELDLQAVRLFADVNLGRVQHFSGGFGFGF